MKRRNVFATPRLASGTSLSASLLPGTLTVYQIPEGGQTASVVRWAIWPPIVATGTGGPS
jgi:hypothetical protein